ncbi:MAG TPA: hypothetical protein VF443_16575, partial [Nitrospira sp.]
FTVTRSSGLIHGRIACIFSSLVIRASFLSPTIPIERHTSIKRLFDEFVNRRGRERVEPGATWSIAA